MFSLLLSVSLPISFSLPPPLHNSSIKRLVNRYCLSTCHRAGSMCKDGEFEFVHGERKGNSSKSWFSCKQVWKICLQTRVNLGLITQGIILCTYRQLNLFCIDCYTLIVQKGKIAEILFSGYDVLARFQRNILITSLIILLVRHWIGHSCCLSSCF